MATKNLWKQWLVHYTFPVCKKVFWYILIGLKTDADFDHYTDLSLKIDLHLEFRGRLGNKRSENETRKAQKRSTELTKDEASCNRGEESWENARVGFWRRRPVPLCQDDWATAMSNESRGKSQILRKSSRFFSILFSLSLCFQLSCLLIF